MDWVDLASSALTVGAQIYQGQIQKKAARQAAKANLGAGDFPQLGMGLATTSPARTPNPFYTPDSPMGQVMNYLGYGEDQGMADGSMVAVSGRARFPTQLVVYTTPSGQMKVGGYRSIGQPVLWSGDFAAARRLARVRKKLGVHSRRPR